MQLTAVITSLLLSTGSLDGAAPRIDIRRLSEGVYAVTRREPPSLYFESNSVFLIGERDVIVVDAQFSTETTLEVLAALRRLTDKPVKYVINTHGHDDHVTGNQVYRDSFPGVEFVAHRATRDSMVAVGARKRADFLASLPGTIGYFRQLLRDGKGFDGSAISDEERAGLVSDSTIGARFLAEAPRLTLVPATRVVDDRLVLRQGARTVEVLWLGPAHSAGDLVVHLPVEHIVAAGDLVVAPVPLVGSTSHPAAFARALGRLRSLRPRIIVPGHGPVQRDERHVTAVERMLSSIRSQVEAAVARGDTLADARRHVELAEFRDLFAGDSRLQRFVFQNYVTGTAVAAAFADLAAAGATGTSQALAISNVNVLTMTSERVMRDATVIVRDGRIAAVGPSRSTEVPDGARRIDGGGKYLVPGLADMHAHLFADEWVADSVAPAELGVYLAHGVTSIRLQIGTPQHLELRRKIFAGELSGPRLWVSSPQLSADSAKNTLLAASAAQGRAAVRSARGSGYDFIKLTTNITPEVYEAIVDEARVLGIRVTGHVDPRVGVARALEVGQQVEHLDNYMESILADSAPSRVSVSDVAAYRAANWNSLAYVDERKLEALAGATARAGVYVTPTLAFFKTWFATRYSDDEVRARPDFLLIPPAMRDPYLRSRARYWQNPPTDAQRARYVALRNRMVRAIVDSGGQVMAGSDGPGGLMAYGWMMHRELEALVAAGLSPFEALRAGTVVPAEWLGASAEQGTIEVGKRADFMVLGADPLADITNTSRIEGVAIGGVWRSAVQLQAMIAAARMQLNPPGTARPSP